MDFGESPLQRQLREAALRFAREGLVDPSLPAREREGVFSRELWAAAAGFGVMGAIAPEAAGGGGMDLQGACRLLEALGEGCADAGLLFSIGAQTFAFLRPLLAFGSEAQRARWLGPLIRGEVIAAHAMTEGESGSDAFAVNTRAAREGAEWVLTGHKLWATNAPVADVALVFARTGQRRGFAALSGFLVPLDAPGVHRGAAEDMAGLRTSPIGELAFDGVRLPAGALLGREGSGALVFLDSMQWERPGIMAAGLGAARRSLDACAAFARSRRVGGAAIGGFQAVSHRLADMAARLEAARLLVYQAAWRVDRRRPGTHAAMAKLAASDALVQNALDAVRLHGAMGLTREAGLERDLRDALMSCAYSGTADIQRGLIARGLGLR